MCLSWNWLSLETEMGSSDKKGRVLRINNNSSNAMIPYTVIILYSEKMIYRGVQFRHL